MGLAELKENFKMVIIKVSFNDVSCTHPEKQIKKRRLTGFDNGLGDINSKTRSWYHLVVTKITRRLIMLNLRKGQGFQPTQKMKVEPMTLKALVRERIEAGKEMPTEIFGVFSENKTTIKRNK